MPDFAVECFCGKDQQEWRQIDEAESVHAACQSENPTEDEHRDKCFALQERKPESNGCKDAEERRPKTFLDEKDEIGLDKVAD